MSDVCSNIDEYNLCKKCNVLIVFDNMIACIISNKKPNQIVTEIFITGRKLNISTVFIMQFYFKVPNDVTLDSTNYFIMKIPS